MVQSLEHSFVSVDGDIADALHCTLLQMEIIHRCFILFLLALPVFEVVLDHSAGYSPLARSFDHASDSTAFSQAKNTRPLCPATELRWPASFIHEGTAWAFPLSMDLA